MTKVKGLVKKFDSRDKAIEYLVKETKLSKEECSMAYDFYMGDKYYEEDEC